MARAKISYGRFLRIRREAEEVAAMVKSPGWKLVEEDLLREMSKIEEMLAENRLRTVSETVVTGGNTRTYTTTAETQIAENAGMFKMGRWLFSDIQTIMEAPAKLAALEDKKQVVVEKAADSTPIPPDKPVPFKIPKPFERLRKVINKLVTKVEEARG